MGLYKLAHGEKAKLSGRVDDFQAARFITPRAVTLSLSLRLLGRTKMDLLPASWVLAAAVGDDGESESYFYQSAAIHFINLQRYGE